MLGKVQWLLAFIGRIEIGKGIRDQTDLVRGSFTSGSDLVKQGDVSSSLVVNLT